MQKLDCTLPSLHSSVPFTERQVMTDSGWCCSKNCQNLAYVNPGKRGKERQYTSCSGVQIYLKKWPNTCFECTRWGCEGVHCRIQVQDNTHLFLLSTCLIQTPQGCVYTSHLLSVAFLLCCRQVCVWEGLERILLVEIYPRKTPKHGSYIEKGVDVSLSHTHPYSGKAV